MDTAVRPAKKRAYAVVDLMPVAWTMAKKRAYAVVVGRQPGIYASWPECQHQTNKFKGAKYKGFSTEAEAEEYLRTELVSDALLTEPTQAVTPAAVEMPWTHDGPREAEARRGLLEFQFDAVQLQVISRAQAGENIFLTGVAGTGKSKVTERIVSDAKAKFGARRVAIAAPTGVAALNVGGCTIHSVAKIRPPNRAGQFGAMSHPCEYK